MELADIVKSFGPEFLAQFADRLSATQHRALRDIAACRSAALGGHVAQCHDCGYRQVAYNSCRNRHCPKCQAAARAQWTEARTAELLPVPYFHVVFTMPAELRPVALQNKRVVYDLLFRAAAESLQQLSADPKHLGAQIGCLAVLHTWSQNLMHHPHVHCIVPAGGLTPDNQWVTCRRSPKTGKVFFLPIKALSRLFQGKLVAYLKQAHRDGTIQFRGDLEALSETTAFHGLLDVAVRRDWVVYVKRPFGGPEQVLKYLARYTHRVAISNQRLLELQDGQVRFHWKDYADHGIRKVMTLSASEFLRRFLLHVLPSGFMRIRYYGFLGNRIRREKLALCRELIGERMLLDEPPDAHHVEEEPEQEGKPGPQCRSGRLLITETIVPHEAHRSIRPWHLTRVSSASRASAKDLTAVHRDRKDQPSESYGGECLGVYYHRLLRDGWMLVDQQNVGKWKSQDIFEKSIGQGWTLRKIAHAEVGAPVGKGCYWDEHELVGQSDGQFLSCPDWEWADVDGKRIVWAAHGKLFAATVKRNGLAEEVELHDFNDMKFEAIEAPY